MTQQTRPSPLWDSAPRALRKGDAVFGIGTSYEPGRPALITITPRMVVGSLGAKQGHLTAAGAPARERAYRSDDGVARTTHGVLYEAGREIEAIAIARDEMRLSIEARIEADEERLPHTRQGTRDFVERNLARARADLDGRIWETAPIFVVTCCGQPQISDDAARAYVAERGIEGEAYPFFAVWESRRRERDERGRLAMQRAVRS